MPPEIQATSMERGQPCQTAMSAAVARGTHRLWDDPPWIIDDPFALVLVGPGWEDLAAASRSLLRPSAWREGHTGVLVRSRYSEDRLMGGSFSQYVILGAGLDSFAWRRPELLRSLQVFEVDRPAAQAWKRERMASLALPASERHFFVPVDFETQTLCEELGEAGFDWQRPTLFSAIGTSMYLKPDSVEATLRLVGTCAAGSEIVLSYNLEASHIDDVGREILNAVAPASAALGAPLKSAFSPAAMEASIERAGLVVVEHPTSDELCARYCAGRTDGMRPYTLERLIAARRP